ncbi:HAD family hydrolase [Psychrobacter alimentarius]|uniref:HAD family hydrolase n=1 Tax=Psychrobacter alimentarius TaxID=261164 RepID=UPI00191B418A|nr:HAD family hydrolase [Psychrobacter alimentarius]
MNIALFDFDGTITECDTFTPFIRKATPRSRMIVGRLLLMPSILAYRTGILSASSIRQQIVYIGLKGFSKRCLETLGKNHANEFLSNVVRANALDRIQWHLDSGDRVIIVSASLDVYLKPWCDKIGVELICSQLDNKGDILTGKYHKGDCTGAEKVRRVESLIDLKAYEKIYAYGDTKEDDELLQIADEKYFQWEKT